MRATLAAFCLLANIASFAQAQQMTQAQAAAHQRAAKEAEKRNDFKTAVAEYERLVRWFPDNAELLSNFGVALYFNRQTEEALPVFRKAISVKPELVAPHLFTGLAWYQLSNPDAAVSALEQAVKANKADPIARLWLGYSYAAQSRYSEAVQQFEAVRQIDPNNVDAWYARESHTCTWDGVLLRSC